jgi:NAD-dependent DNA ligase
VIGKVSERGATTTPWRPTAVAPDARRHGHAAAEAHRYPMTAVVIIGAISERTHSDGNEAVEPLDRKSSGSVSHRTDRVVVGERADSKAEKTG